jgi:Ca2+-binding EF-hand superfamily protein
MNDRNEHARELFMQYATGKTVANEIYMTKHDFCECFDLSEESVDAIGYFNLADSDDTDGISFDEFVSFQNLMGTSSFEILGLAHVLDKDENDRISAEEWSTTLSGLVPPKELFGKDLSKEISFREFEAWMRKLEANVVKHDWKLIARQKDNTASVRDFLNIISRHTRADVMIQRSPYIVENICTYFQGKDDKGRVSYQAFQVFMNIMNSRQALAQRLIGLDENHDGIVSESEFDHVIQQKDTPKDTKAQLEMMFDIFMDPVTRSVNTDDFLHFAGSVATRGPQKSMEMTLFESLGIGIISGAVGMNSLDVGARAARISLSLSLSLTHTHTNKQHRCNCGLSN